MPRPRPIAEKDPTTRVETPATKGGAKAPIVIDGVTIEFAPNGKPRDPNNGFLMSETNPMYNRAMGIKEAPTPASTADRDKARGPGANNTPVMRLPELAPPGQIRSESAGKNRNEQKTEQREQASETPTRSGLTLSLTPGLKVPTGVALERQERALLAASDAERGVKPLVRPTPEYKPNVIKTTGGIAGTVQLPENVRPNVTIPNLDRIAETLPGGSNQTYAGQEASKPTPKTKTSAQQNIDLARQEQEAARGNVALIRPIGDSKLAKPSQAGTTKDSKSKTQKAAVAALPQLSVVVDASPNTKKKPTPTTEGLPSKNASGPGAVLSGLLEGLFGDWGADLQSTRKSLGKMFSYETKPLTSKVAAYQSQGMSPSEAYETTNRAETQNAIANAKDPGQAQRLNERLGNI